MAAEFTNKDWSANILYNLVGKAGDLDGWDLPAQITLEDWLEYSGAELAEKNLTNPTR